MLRANDDRGFTKEYLRVCTMAWQEITTHVRRHRRYLCVTDQAYPHCVHVLCHLNITNYRINCAYHLYFSIHIYNLLALLVISAYHFTFSHYCLNYCKQVVYNLFDYSMKTAQHSSNQPNTSTFLFIILYCTLKNTH